MSTIINGVTCQELVNGYHEDIATNHGLTSRKGYLCPWGSRFQVARGLLGLSHSTSIGGLVTLYTPQPHPETPTAFVTSINIQGVGHPVQGPTQLSFDNAIVWANYDTVPWFGNDPFNQIDPAHPFIFAEQKLTSGCEWFQVPATACTWAVGGTVDQPVAFRVAIIELEITIKNLPYMPTPAALLYGGCINSSSYLGVAPGSLLFNGVTTQQNALSDGTKVQEATYKFAYRTIRWDNMFNPKTGAFDQVLIGGNPMLASVDLSQVIPSYYHGGIYPGPWGGG